ncbi:MAG: methyltransferase domain-containing protein [Nanopusillaceae archaeon]
MKKETIAETIKKYDEIAPLYFKRWDRLTSNEIYFLNLFCEFLEGDVILDMGCGTGKDGLYFKKRGYKVIGIDLSKGMLSYASKRIDTIRCDLRYPPIREESVDGIWCNSALVHVYSKKEVIDSWYRILKKKGIIGITIQNCFYPKYLFRQLQTLFRNKEFKFGYANYDGRHWYYSSIFELDNLFDERFEIIFRSKNPFERWLRIYAKKR